jgi:Tfp pilus assembly protein PilF
MPLLSPTFDPEGNSPPIVPPPTSSRDQGPVSPVTLLLRQAYQLMGQNQLDAALDQVNAALQAAPKNTAAYVLRGNIYATQKLWDQAEKDYQAALRLDGQNVQIKFNLIELDFMQKKYDAARPGFLALGQDPDLGDLATYKVFLCDLFSAHEALAASELAAFNQASSTASYYFAHAAWSLYHHKTEDARDWLTSAASIYSPDTFKAYATSLINLGYMPLPPPLP